MLTEKQANNKPKLSLKLANYLLLSVMLISCVGVVNSIKNYFLLNNEKNNFYEELISLKLTLSKQENELKFINEDSIDKAIEVKTELYSVPMDSGVNESNYQVLSKIYADPKTENNTKTIIKEIMSDGVVSISEYSKYSSLFNSEIERINQEKLKKVLIKAVK